MKLLSQINIPQVLWKLHGRRTYLLDLILTYIFALALTVLSLNYFPDLTLWKKVIIIILSFDIGGGVISNFTKGTIKYYGTSKLSPHIFIWFHLLQSLAFILVYDHFTPEIIIISLGTMLFSSLTIKVITGPYKRQVNVFVYASMLAAITLLTNLPSLLNLLLLLMAFKLLVGFSGNYKRVS